MVCHSCDALKPREVMDVRLLESILDNHKESRSECASS
jgi:hypothetical protein